MYFDYAVLAFMIWGAGEAIFGKDDISENSGAEPDLIPDTQTETPVLGGDLLDAPDPDSTDETDVDATGYLYVSGTTTITIETAGEVATSTFEDVDFGIAPTISGGIGADSIVASVDTGMALNIEGGAGANTVSFGYGANVDGGADADVLSLTVTQNALAADTDVGQINMSDTDDTLDVTFEDETPEFVHTVRGQTTETVDGVTTRTDWVDYYVSDTADLTAEDLTPTGGYEAADTTRVFRAVLGSGTDAAINDPPAIPLNREIASAIDARG